MARSREAALYKSLNVISFPFRDFLLCVVSCEEDKYPSDGFLLTRSDLLDPTSVPFASPTFIGYTLFT